MQYVLNIVRSLRISFILYNHTNFTYDNCDDESRETDPRQIFNAVHCANLIMADTETDQDKKRKRDEKSSVSDLDNSLNQDKEVAKSKKKRNQSQLK